MTARPHTILKTLKQESNNQLCLALSAGNVFKVQGSTTNLTFMDF